MPSPHSVVVVRQLVNGPRCAFGYSKKEYEQGATGWAFEYRKKTRHAVYLCTINIEYEFFCDFVTSSRAYTTTSPFQKKEL